MSVGDAREVGLLPGATAPAAGPTSAICDTRARSAPSDGELNEAFESLQEQSRRTGAALGTAAHQLKTPLAIVAGYVDILLSEKTGALNDRQRKILEESSLNCARLRRFVDDFLSFSAFEAGKITLKLEEGDLRVCLSELRQYWLPSFNKKGVALSLAHPRVAVQPFPFDYDKVQHVVSNLLENALKFTPAGGAVELALEPYYWERRSSAGRYLGEDRRTRSSRAPNTMRVSVTDTGPGVAPEYRQEIFEDFVKLPCGREEGSGTGLGLAIARRFVLAHGGKIWVEGDRLRGSIFRFLLPLNP
ncbi:MAG TPA: HAMP domain-containing sensor histidine kinase [Terriglobia bacterium]|nr:HAMP domain-containing sensor histidine kinase [Terriglobia bacterium]